MIIFINCIKLIDSYKLCNSIVFISTVEDQLIRSAMLL